MNVKQFKQKFMLAQIYPPLFYIPIRDKIKYKKMIIETWAWGLVDLDLYTYVKDEGYLVKDKCATWAVFFGEDDILTAASNESEYAFSKVDDGVLRWEVLGSCLIPSDLRIEITKAKADGTTFIETYEYPNIERDVNVDYEFATVINRWNIKFKAPKNCVEFKAKILFRNIVSRITTSVKLSDGNITFLSTIPKYRDYRQPQTHCTWTGTGHKGYMGVTSIEMDNQKIFSIECTLGGSGSRYDSPWADTYAVCGAENYGIHDLRFDLLDPENSGGSFGSPIIYEISKLSYTDPIMEEDNSNLQKEWINGNSSSLDYEIMETYRSSSDSSVIYTTGGSSLITFTCEEYEETKYSGWDPFISGPYTYKTTTGFDIPWRMYYTFFLPAYDPLIPIFDDWDGYNPININKESAGHITSWQMIDAFAKGVASATVYTKKDSEGRDSATGTDYLCTTNARKYGIQYSYTDSAWGDYKWYEIEPSPRHYYESDIEAANFERIARLLISLGVIRSNKLEVDASDDSIHQNTYETIFGNRLLLCGDASCIVRYTENGEQKEKSAGSQTKFFRTNPDLDPLDYVGESVTVSTFPYISDTWLKIAKNVIPVEINP